MAAGPEEKLSLPVRHCHGKPQAADEVFLQEHVEAD